MTLLISKKKMNSRGAGDEPIITASVDKIFAVVVGLSPMMNPTTEAIGNALDVVVRVCPTSLVSLLD